MKADHKLIQEFSKQLEELLERAHKIIRPFITYPTHRICFQTSANEITFFIASIYCKHKDQSLVLYRVPDADKSLPMVEVNRLKLWQAEEVYAVLKEIVATEEDNSQLPKAL